MSEEPKIPKATVTKLIDKIDELQSEDSQVYTLRDTIYQLIPSIAILENRGYKLADVVSYLNENGVIISDRTLVHYLREIQSEAYSMQVRDRPICPGLPDLELNPQLDKILGSKDREYYQVILHHLSDESVEVKIAVLKIVRWISGLGLKDAKDAVDSTNAIVLSGVHKIVAEYIRYKLEKTGGIASIEPIKNPGYIPNNERFLPNSIDEIEFYEGLTLDQKQEWKNRCIFAAERRNRVSKLRGEFWELQQNRN